MQSTIMQFNPFSKSLFIAIVLVTFLSDMFGQSPFITKWVTITGDTEITLTVDPNLSYNYDIDWNGDGVYDTLGVMSGASYDYGVQDTFSIQIRGTYPHITFNTSPDKTRLISVDQWGSQAWTSMASSFEGCFNMQLSPSAGVPNLSGVTDMSYMFAGCSAFNANINTWNVTNVENGSHLFEGCTAFNQPLDNWSFYNVTDLSYVFNGCTSYNQPTFSNARNFTPDRVVNAEYAFYNCISFDWPVSWPEEGNYTSMFEGCTSFNNATPPSIVLSSVSRNCDRMFKNASSFNQPIVLISFEDYSKSISEMFSGAVSFDQDISDWTIEGINSADGFMDGVTLSTAHYDSLLLKWSEQDPSYENVNISFGNSRFCVGEAGRDSLQDVFGWSIQDNGYDFSCLPMSEQFITTWRTTSPGESITIPTFPGAPYSYAVDWGDGTGELDKNGSASHVYADTGLHIVKIYGTFPRIYFNNSGDKVKLLSVDRWGDQQWSSMARAFYGCSNLTLTAPDSPDLTSVTDMSYMFAGCSAFNANINTWNVINVENGSHLFEGCTTFNQPLDNWNLGNVTDLSYVFSGCTSFDQPAFNSVGDLTSDAVVNVEYAFFNCIVFDQSVSWPFAGEYTSMFEGCTSFNSSAPNLVLDSNSGNCKRMFKNASSFNQPVSLYSERNVASSISEMFSGAVSFDQDISDWTIEGINSADGFMDGVTLSTAHYDSLLLKWSEQDPSDENVSISFGESMYCTGDVGKAIIESEFGWSISDGGSACPPFITTWVTTGSDQVISLTVDANMTYDYDVDWDSDGVFDTLGVTGAIDHDYGIVDTVTISIRGTYPHITFNTSPDKTKLISVDQWGSQVWQSMATSFTGCSNMHINALDAPDLSQVTDMSDMLSGCTVFNEPINHWDVSNVTNMAKMFAFTARFNQSLDQWDVSKVENMEWMFANAREFNQNINNWDVGKVSNDGAYVQDCTFLQSTS